jgi:hypothetical protein
VFYFGFGALILLLASIPYLYGLWNTPPGHVYTGLTYNIDDVCVYLSWFRQAQSGSFFQRNLFNTDPQQGLQFSVLSLLLGNIARLTSLSLPVVFHIARVVFGALLLWAIVGLLRETIQDARARRIAFALVGISSGLGWVLGGYDATKDIAKQPIDVWQPEAITFLSLYFAPLFTAALALMVVFLTAMLRSERTNKFADIWPAALSGILLANFHTYDVIPLFAVAGAFRIVTDAVTRRFSLAGWVRLIATGILTLPSLGYTYFALIQDPLFKSRDVKTLSGSLVWVLVGLGLPLLLAVVATVRPDISRYRDLAAWRLLVLWAVMAIAVSYLPVDFQRKMLMGVHIPLCLLAGVALTTLTSRLSGDFPKIAASVVIAVSAVSNGLFLMRDIERLSVNIGSTENRPYFTTAEADALTFLREKTDHRGAVLAPPDPGSHLRFPNFPLKPYLSVFIPAFTGHPVYNGHWSETASYGQKLLNTLRFFRRDTDDDFRKTLLQENHIRYVLYVNALADGIPPFPDGSPVTDENGSYIPVDWRGNSAPSYLNLLYQNAEIKVYEVTPSLL